MTRNSSPTSVKVHYPCGVELNRGTRAALSGGWSL
jgi:hypothetical protein